MSPPRHQSHSEAVRISDVAHADDAGVLCTLDVCDAPSRPIPRRDRHPAANTVAPTQVDPSAPHLETVQTSRTFAPTEGRPLRGLVPITAIRRIARSSVETNQVRVAGQRHLAHPATRASAAAPARSSNAPFSPRRIEEVVHAAGRRRTASVDCAALSPRRIETQLSDRQHGRFTGATGSSTCLGR